jgi:hypothetical protein
LETFSEPAAQQRFDVGQSTWKIIGPGTSEGKASKVQVTPPSVVIAGSLKSSWPITHVDPDDELKADDCWGHWQVLPASALAAAA